MPKLNKMQAQAIISKLGREAKALRDKKIAELEANYVPSDEAKEILRLVALKEEYNKKKSEVFDEARRRLEALGVKSGFYEYTKEEDVAQRIKEAEVKSATPENIDLDAALDELIIMSIDEDFDPEGFISTYLKEQKL